MDRFTIFTLAGPFASFGGVAGNERRGSMARPGHSMLVGLLAAALGIRRDQESRLSALSSACRFAVRVDASGLPLVDYHTVQTAKNGGNFTPNTRRDLLLKSDIFTSVTQREYLTDIRITAAVALSGEEFTHLAICQALSQPRLPLYLGRKACPLALPLSPWTSDLVDVREAFSAYDSTTGGRATKYWPLPSERTLIAADADLFKAEDLPRHRLERRRVRPLGRKTWQFALLNEFVLLDSRSNGALA